MVSSPRPDGYAFKIKAQNLTALSSNKERFWAKSTLELNHGCACLAKEEVGFFLPFFFFLQLFPGIFYCTSQTYASSMVLQFIFVFLQGNHSSME